MAWKVKFTPEDKQALILHGADRALSYENHEGFELENQLVSFKPKIPAFKTKNFSTVKQYNSLLKLLEKPISRHPLVVISSYPTDSKAKLVAGNLMLSAIKQFRNMGVRQRKGRTRPIWHKLYGGFRDSLLDGDSKPSFIVISNVTDNSSPQRLEKLRDILEKYNDVPRVVVMGSSVDPVTFLGRALYLQIKYGYFITSENVVHKKLLDLY